MKKTLFSLLLVAITAQNSFTASVCTVIDFPGTYEFSALELFPTDPNDCGISVQTDDVIIDFGGEFLTQDSSSTATGFIGIRIEANHANITIKNVDIKFLTGIGIYVADGCSNIRIENVTINDCDISGIVFAGTTVNQINDCFINNVFVTSCTGFDGNPAFGIRLIQCDNIELCHSTLNQNDGQTSNSGFGLSLEHCSACNIHDCQVNNNGGNVRGVGICLFETQWTTLCKCTILNSIARSSMMDNKAAGVLLEQSSHNVVKNCIVKHSNNLVGNAYGFESCNGNDNTFKNCISKNNSAGVVTAGFILRGNELRSNITHCRASLNDGGVSGAGYGILLDTAQNCDILFNEEMGNSGSTGIGLRDTVTNTTNLIAGNLSFVNTTTGFDVMRTMGAFPVLSAQVGDFSNITNASPYMNIFFSTGP